ncbi:MAG: leucyl aminopeptidase family protein [Candidatus Spechtbacteria bacterium SB0662_bin_43]|uniref:Probable cytosol aminopeptidase n=1 Tax=Candidatus Spechtbacteria bacterium SB0662_bin_43 TaxID=2604897 RepID=A0A845DJ95_9BACT|nr:leucyl aminopeptidase family protein [Candidatus Spechtbacteria bacterium SB0662_bin_43]
MKLLCSSFQEHKNAVVIPLFEDKTIAKDVRTCFSNEEMGTIQLFLKQEREWNRGAVHYLFLPNGTHILFVAKGTKEKWSIRNTRVVSRCIVAHLKQLRISEASVDCRALLVDGYDEEEIFELVATEMMMADFSFDTYKQSGRQEKQHEMIVHLAVAGSASKKKALTSAVERGSIIGEEVNSARVLSNTPGSDMTPDIFADRAQKECETHGVTIEVWDENKIQDMGMGGVWGVGKGSVIKPRFLILKYEPNARQSQPLVFAGKGVTFDTGGLNVKPGNAMYEMHMDMSGASAVVRSIIGIARLGVPVNAIGLVPVVENAVSGESYKPGDILTSITGKTIEVLNTDAEGRVILADALGYAQQLNPKLVIDIATLTGAALAALGVQANAFFTNNQESEGLIRDLGEKSGDYMWQLPLWEEYEQEVKGVFGDVANTGKSRYGGTIAGAMFLKEFVDYPWAHIDMAPTMVSSDGDYLAKGAKGTGVRFLIAVARHFAAKK